VEFVSKIEKNVEFWGNFGSLGEKRICQENLRRNFWKVLKKVEFLGSETFLTEVGEI
jgi:hypothetical protein